MAQDVSLAKDEVIGDFPGDLAVIRAAKEAWKKHVVAKAEAKMPSRRERFSTWSDADVPDLVTPADAHVDYLRDLGFPGEYPFTRGVQPTMYRSRLWTMRMFAGFGTPEQTNARFKYLLAQGQTGLSTAFDFPTLMGYDSDSPRSLGEVGMCGVAVDTLRDMEVLFDGIPLDKVTTSMTINGPAIVLLAFYVALADVRGIPRTEIGGTVQNDCLKEFIAQHAWLVPPRPGDAHRHGHDRVLLEGSPAVEHASRSAATTSAKPERRPPRSSRSRSPTASATSSRASQRGLNVDDFAPRLSFFFDVHNDFFEEIAKFRAARRIWARLMKERFGAKKAESMKLRTHAQTAGVSLTAQQPYNNVVRVALQALAAVLGGTQSLHTNSLDETYALPTEEAVTIALRTQQIIAEESGVASTIDPLGGSYFVEEMTNRIETEALAYIRRIDEMERHGLGDREGLPAARDRRERLPLPAPARARRARDGRREQVRDRSRREHPDAPHRRDGAEAAAREPREGEGLARRGEGQGDARRGPQGVDLGREPDAADHRGREGLLHAAGDLRRAPRDHGDVHGPRRVLRVSASRSSPRLPSPASRSPGCRCRCSRCR